MRRQVHAPMDHYISCPQFGTAEVAVISARSPHPREGAPGMHEWRRLPTHPPDLSGRPHCLASASRRSFTLKPLPSHSAVWGSSPHRHGPIALLATSYVPCRLPFLLGDCLGFVPGARALSQPSVPSAIHSAFVCESLKLPMALCTHRHRSCLDVLSVFSLSFSRPRSLRSSVSPIPLVSKCLTTYRQ